MKKITLLAALIAVFSVQAQVTIWEDGFESYPDFETASIGSYTQIDMDGDATYGSTTYDFTNEGYTGTAIIWNASQTSPASTGTVYDVRTGSKGLYFFASTGSVSGTPLNNDYFITPQIDLSLSTGGTTLSFWAQSVTADFGLERFEVLLSTSGTAVGDFTVNLSGGEEMAPEGVYTEYTYDLSAYEGMQVYVAIHYVAQDSFILQMDDFKVESATLGVDDNVIAGFTQFVDAQNQLHLRANETLAQLSLYNVVGQQVINQTLNRQEAQVSLASLNSGVYIATVTTTAGANKTFKIVKQ